MNVHERVRRRLISTLAILAIAPLLLGLPACRRASSPKREVVLYSSVDAEIIKPILEVFERKRGIAVRLVGDTEATKTTGLAQRLLNERDNPQADVWWSSEALATVRLAEAGVLAPMPPRKGETDLANWPPELRGSDWEWTGFALRARVFVFNPKKVAPNEVPATLADLCKPAFKGRVGMARPEFGTTRGHVAALRHLAGNAAVDAWLDALKANDLRLYDGNASVVRAIANGEIDLGLTDTDDVLAGLANGWAIAQAYESRGTSAAGSPAGGTPSPEPVTMGLLATGTGALLIPNTVALVKGTRRLESAVALVEFIRSARMERLLAESAWKTWPARADLAKHFPAQAVPTGTLVDWEAVAADANPQ